jgi:hypothetical protein
MKLPNQIPPRLPVEDYSRAIDGAVSWLGDRYLLASPINVRSQGHSPWHFFAEGRPGWHQRISDRR